jgi:hypothetical protein
MSALLLTFLVLPVGAVTYRLFDRLVRSVRIFVVCLLMVSLTAFILQSREIFSQFIKSGGVFSFATFSDKGAPNVPSPTDDRGSVTDVRYQSISQQDQNFLDEIPQNQNADDQKQGQGTRPEAQTDNKTEIVGSGDESILKGELVINSAGGRRSELVAHKDAVRRAQLVNHNEMLKRVHQGRSKQP